MKKLMVCFLTLMLATSLAACSSKPAVTSSESSESTSAGSEEGLKIGICVATMTNEYFVEFAEGAEAYCKANGIECLIKDANDDISKQVTAMEDFVNAGCDAIVINALDDEALRSVTAEAVSKGIPVIAESVEVEGCTAGAILDEYEYGYALGVEAGKWAEEHFTGEEVQFAVLTQSTLPTTIARSEGIIDGVMENCPTAVCVKEEDAYTTDKGVTVAENILNAYPDIKMILGMNDAGALGAFEAVAAHGIDIQDRDNFFIGGTDGNAQAIEQIDAGTIYQCTIKLTESNPTVGENCVKKALEALEKGEVDTYWIEFEPYLGQE